MKVVALCPELTPTIVARNPRARVTWALKLRSLVLAFQGQGFEASVPRSAACMPRDSPESE